MHQYFDFRMKRLIFKSLCAKIKKKAGDNMENYKKLLKLGCFTFSEANAVFGNVNTTKTVIRNLKAHGLVESVKRNLYVAVSMEKMLLLCLHMK